MVWAASAGPASIHNSDCGDMPYLCDHTADLGEACPDIHLVRSDRNDAGYRLCIDPRDVVPPHRSLHWSYNSWFPLELDFGNGGTALVLFASQWRQIHPVE